MTDFMATSQVVNNLLVAETDIKQLVGNSKTRKEKLDDYELTLIVLLKKIYRYHQRP
jgi:hypothetical protein